MQNLEYFSVKNEKAPLRLDVTGLTVVLGANGAGKTSFLQKIHGINPSFAQWNGMAASQSKSMRGYVSQSPIWLTGSVFKQLTLAGQLQGLPAEQCFRRAHEQLARMGLLKMKDRKPSTLSGGEQAKLALACASIHHPKVLLLDEVTAHLDPVSAREFEGELSIFASHEGHAVIFITHDLMQAMRLARDIIFIQNDQVSYVGDAANFWKSDEIAIRQFVAGVSV